MSVSTGRAQQVTGQGLTPTESAGDLLRQGIAEDARAATDNGGVPSRGQGSTVTAKTPDASSRGLALARQRGEQGTGRQAGESESRPVSTERPPAQPKKAVAEKAETDSPNDSTADDSDTVRLTKAEYNALKATAGRAQSFQSQLAQVKKGLSDTTEMADFYGTANRDVRQVVDDTIKQLVSYARQNGTVDPLDMFDFVQKNINYDEISNKAKEAASARRREREFKETNEENLSAAETARLNNLQTTRSNVLVDIHGDTVRTLRDRALDFGVRLTEKEAKDFITESYKDDLVRLELEQIQDLSLPERDFQRYSKSAYQRVKTLTHEMLENKIADEESKAIANGKPAVVARPRVHGTSGSNQAERRARDAGSGRYSREDMNRMSARDLLAIGFEDDGIYTQP